MQQVFGQLSAMLSVLAFLPYILGTLRGRTQPQRASWTIWGTLSSLSFAALLYEGASSSLWFVGAQAAGTVTVAALGVPFGTGGYNRRDLVILALAGVGLVLWGVTKDAAWTLALAISVSLLGGVPTVLKAWRSAPSESLRTWVLLLLSALCSLASVARPEVLLLAYPVFLSTLYGAIVAAIGLGHLRDRRWLQDATRVTGDA
jgi:hypothetical protein